MAKDSNKNGAADAAAGTNGTATSATVAAIEASATDGAPPIADGLVRMKYVKGPRLGRNPTLGTIQLNSEHDVVPLKAVALMLGGGFEIVGGAHVDAITTFVKAIKK